MEVAKIGYSSMVFDIRRERERGAVSSIFPNLPRSVEKHQFVRIRMCACSCGVRDG